MSEQVQPDQTIVPESSQQPVDQHVVQELQAGRQYLAEQRTAELLKASFDVERAVQGSLFSGLKPDDWWSDAFRPSAGDLLACEAFGADAIGLAERLGQSSQEGEPLLESVVGTGKVLLQTGSSMLATTGLKAKYESADKDHPTTTDELRIVCNERLHTRVARSPTYAAIKQAERQGLQDEVIPESIITEPFDGLADPLVLLAFMQDAELISWDTQIIPGLQASRSGKTYVKQLMLAVASSGRTAVRDTADTRTFTWGWGSGLRKHLILNTVTDEVRYRVDQRPTDLYVEHANQSHESTSLPFIETDCAAQLSQALDQAGLMFSPTVQQEMMSMKSADRYGSVYTQLSREIAKWINTPARTALHRLFVPKDDQLSGRRLAERLADGDAIINSELVVAEQEPIIRERFLAWSQSAKIATGSQAADQVLAQVTQVLQRGTQAVGTDLPVTANQINIRDGSCFDITSYYVGGAFSMHDHNRLRLIDADGVSLLEDRASKTFMTTEPVIFNGISLPKGALFKQAADDKWGFMRLTPYSFDAAADQLAFGSEMTKTRDLFSDKIARLGTLSIASLQART